MERANIQKVYTLLKFLIPRKFCFILSLKTGVQFYTLSSFITSVLIADILLTKVIDHHPWECRGYHSASDIFNCLDGVKPQNVLDKKSVEELRNFNKQIELRSFYSNKAELRNFAKNVDALKNFSKNLRTFIVSIDELRTFSMKQIILLHFSLAFLSALVLYFLNWRTLLLYWSGAKMITAVLGLWYFPEWIQVFLQLFDVSIHLTWILMFSTILDVHGLLIALGYYLEILDTTTLKDKRTSPKDPNTDFPDPPDLDIALSSL